jgi:YVTN family beta-propeller protein
MLVPQHYRQLEGSERRQPPGARLLGAADHNERLSVILCIRRRADAPPLPDFAYWTRTLSQRRFPSHEEFARRYGAAQEDLDRVASFARGQGLTIVEADVGRRTVVVSGTVERMSQAFAVDLRRYESAQQTYRGREGYIYLPTEIADLVEGVFGLDNRRAGEDDTGPNADPNPASFLDVPTIKKGYSFPTGTANGQTIALPCFHGGYNNSDLQSYFGSLGLPVPNITNVGVNSPGNPSSDFEITQDICVAGSVAPGAAIVVYFVTPDQFGWISFLSQAISNPSVSVISVSRRIAIDDDLNTIMTDGGFTQNGVTQLEGLLQTAAAKGITVFMSSGDNGSEFNGAQHRVHWPASNPWVTACGGTSIGDVQSPTSWQEWPWNDTNSFLGNHATGGGISERYPLPPYQSLQAGLVTQASLNDGGFRRGVPDIAGNASPNSGYPITVDGETMIGGWPVTAWGTSIVAPMYAGLAALLNASLGHRIGFLNPYLYALNGFGFRVVRNITLAAGSPPDNGVGAAPGYPARRPRVGPGWDACTGLGVVFGDALLAALRGFLSPSNAPFYAYIANLGPDGRNPIGSISVVDPTTNMMVALIPVGREPRGVAVAPDRAHVYVANADGTVSVIAAATNAVAATVMVGQGPQGLAVTSDGAHVYVANEQDGTVSVIATATNRVATTVPVGARPRGVAVTSDGAHVYVTNNRDGTVSVIATATNAVVATVAVGADPWGVAVTPDGAHVYVANQIGPVSVIATATNTVAKSVPVGANTIGIAVTPDGTHVYVANDSDGTVSVIATATNMVVATVPVGPGVSAVAVTPDGANVYVAHATGQETGGFVTVIATKTNTVVADLVAAGPAKVFIGKFI